MHDHLFQLIGAMRTVGEQRFHQRFIGNADQQRHAVFQMLDDIQQLVLFLGCAGNKDKTAALRGLPAHIRVKNALELFFVSGEKEVFAAADRAEGEAGVGRVKDEPIKIH